MNGLPSINSSHFDVIVIGVGSVGSAATWYLARRGHKVLGLEQFDTPHENGSHAGQSRIIRKAYFEHPDYVPLLERAYDNWRSFEGESRSALYHKTGIVYAGRAENENIKGIRLAANLHGIPIAHWDHEQCQRSLPGFNIPPDFDVIFEADAGFVTPERAISAYVAEAVKMGALIKTHTPVLTWKQEEDKIRVVTPSGDYTGDKLVITAGAWTSRVLPGLRSKLLVTRQTLAWVTPPEPGRFAMGNFPCWFVEDPDLGTFYGFPVLTSAFPGPIGLKLAHHHPGDACEPEAIRGEASADDLEKLRYLLKTYLPGAGDNIRTTKNCLYTYSPDAHFIIDHLPGFNKRVTIACGFSGHGFKFVPVVGEILADLAVKGTTELPVRFLRAGRF